jgi:hypothetical protein
MNKIIYLPVVFGFAALAGCSSGSKPLNPTSAKADNAAFLSGLPASSRQFAMYCQTQLQQKLGGTVYAVAAPSLQSSDISANATTTALAASTMIVYDQVKDGKVVTGSSVCTPPSQNAKAPTASESH